MIDFESMEDFSISMWVKQDGFSFPHGEWYISFGDDSDSWLGITNSISRPGLTGERFIQFGVSLLGFTNSG